MRVNRIFFCSIFDRVSSLTLIHVFETDPGFTTRSDFPIDGQIVPISSTELVMADASHSFFPWPHLLPAPLFLFLLSESFLLFIFHTAKSHLFTKQGKKAWCYAIYIINTYERQPALSLSPQQQAQKGRGKNENVFQPKPPLLYTLLPWKHLKVFKMCVYDKWTGFPPSIVVTLLSERSQNVWLYSGAVTLISPSKEETLQMGFSTGQKKI